MECQIPEEVKLMILLRIISPRYRSQLGAVQITGVTLFGNLYMRIGQRIYSMEYTPP